MTQRPAHEIRVGRIRATIWVNQADDRNSTFNTTIARLYKDGEVWKDSTVFYRDDLPIVAKLADMAYAWIWSQEAPADVHRPSDNRSTTRN